MQSVLLTLLSAHARARLRRMQAAISTARLMSLVVLVLAAAWTGQTVASVLFREPYEPQVFRLWVAVLLFTWTVWHCVRVAWSRPDTAIEWSEEEEYLIVAGPFTARERLIYRITMLLTATLPKALLTILVLLPDLAWSSPPGIVLALVGLEVFRMLLDIGTCCLSDRGYWWYRTAVGAALAFFIVVCRGQVAALPVATAAEALNFSFGPTQLVETVLRNNVIAAVAVPFFRISDVITANGSVTAVLWGLAAMSGLLLGMLWLTEVLEGVWRNVTVFRERDLKDSPGATAGTSDACNPHRTGALPQIPCCGPLVWRQSKRAIRCYGSVIVALVIPVILLSPLMNLRDPVTAFSLVVCGALFYTFVLLPEAIKFDFRLDCDHLDQLKLLPMSPARIVIGQLTTPVVLACLFQAAVFVGVGVMRSIEPRMVCVAIAVCVPLTILFVAADNLAFLLFPHRPTQEGFEAFLRTILKFTAKSIVMLTFLCLVVAWAPVAAAIADLTSSSTTTVFGIGIVVGIAGLAAGAVACVITAFRRFDISLHAT